MKERIEKKSPKTDKRKDLIIVVLLSAFIFHSVLSYNKAAPLEKKLEDALFRSENLAQSQVLCDKLLTDIESALVIAQKEVPSAAAALKPAENAIREYREYNRLKRVQEEARSKLV
jgi:hypothetical protein